MANGSVSAKGPDTRCRRVVFRGLAIFGAFLVACGGTELLLKFREQRLASRDRLEPGLIRFDPTLGWSVTPGWRGAHRSSEFAVQYGIDWRGFRADSEARIDGDFVAVVGDSFAFGLGVNDTETFVAVLNRGGRKRFVNFSIPGFSTDQEALLIEREILSLEPETILLVVCLVNDLMDNQRPVPLQFNARKPRFEVGPDGVLNLRDSPVPANPPSDRPGGSPVLAALGAPYFRDNLWLSLQARSRLCAWVGERLPVAAVPVAVLHERLDPALELFLKIVGRVRAECDARSVKLVVVLLPGRSFVERPDSLSAQYQAFLLREITVEGAALGLAIRDAGNPLRRRFETMKEPLFYGHDGHLNPRGHGVLAEIVERLLAGAEQPAADPDRETVDRKR